MAKKVLGQSNPAATTATDLFTVGAGKTAVISTLTICNQGSASATYRVYVRVAGAAVNAKQYVAYDASIPGNSTDALTLGITLGAGDVVTVYASTANLSFNAFGDES